VEDLAVIAATALIVPLAMVIADLAGLCMGLGWGYYSKRRKAKRAKEMTND
jgi:membrane associated rhomboid family serine protease